MKRRNVIAPAIGLVAIALSFVSTTARIVLYAFVPPFCIVPGTIDRYWARRRA